ncbi:MAG TPA: hypothetical protein VFY79_02210 [Dehalococcoidia bacterium]|nr:hypothetical protein [Dehalococcoidia bacterium]
MDSQQLSAKVAALEAKVATLEDEGKIIKGEVKQVLTEIRTAILVRDNPFEDAGGTRATAHIAAAPDVSRIAIVAPAPAARQPEPEPEPERAQAQFVREEPEYGREPIMLQTPAPAPPPASDAPQWSLLTIASLTAWAEDAMQRLGALRFEILLDLCEAAGHVSPEARAALSRVKELDVAAPEKAPSTNDTVVVLRQLDALLNDDYEGQGTLRTLHR